MELKIQRMDKDVTLPSYAHPFDAGLDLRSCEPVSLSPREKKVIKTGIKMAIPDGHVGLVWDKSGLAAKKGLHVMAGVIDSGYRGELGVVAVNLGDEEIVLDKNMKIAQLLVQPVVQANIKEVESLDESSRGEDGFGSTGLH